MSRVFRSRVYGRMNKRGRRRLGLQGFRREEVWRMMADQEAALAATAWWRTLSWWARLSLRLLAWLRKAIRMPYKVRLPAGRIPPHPTPERGPCAPPRTHGTTYAAARRR